MDPLILDMTQLASPKLVGVSMNPSLIGERSQVRSEAPAGVSLSFEDLLAASMKKVNDLQLESDDKIQKLATGDVDDISEVVLSASRAEIALKLLIEIRNKFVDAYQTLSRMSA